MCSSGQAGITQYAGIAAPSDDTPTCLDSTGKGKGHRLLYRRSCTRLSERWWMTKDPQSFALRGQSCQRWSWAGSKAAQACQAPKGCTCGPSRRHPSYAELLDMPSECGQQEHSNAVVRATLDEAALQWRRMVETEVFGRYDLVDEEKYTGRATVSITRQ